MARPTWSVLLPSGLALTGLMMCVVWLSDIATEYAVKFHTDEKIFLRARLATHSQGEETWRLRGDNLKDPHPFYQAHHAGEVHAIVHHVRGALDVDDVEDLDDVDWGDLDDLDEDMVEDDVDDIDDIDDIDDFDDVDDVDDVDGVVVTDDRRIIDTTQQANALVMLLICACFLVFICWVLNSWVESMHAAGGPTSWVTQRRAREVLRSETGGRRRGSSKRLSTDSVVDPAPEVDAIKQITRWQLAAEEARKLRRENSLTEGSFDVHKVRNKNKKENKKEKKEGKFDSSPKEEKPSPSKTGKGHARMTNGEEGSTTLLPSSPPLKKRVTIDDLNIHAGHSAAPNGDNHTKKPKFKLFSRKTKRKGVEKGQPPTASKEERKGDIGIAPNEGSPMRSRRRFSVSHSLSKAKAAITRITPNFSREIQGVSVVDTDTVIGSVDHGRRNWSIVSEMATDEDLSATASSTPLWHGGGSTDEELPTMTAARYKQLAERGQPVMDTFWMGADNWSKLDVIKYPTK